MNTGTWAWIVLLAFIAAYVVGYDLWAEATNHITMSSEFHDLMVHQVSGPIVVAAWMAGTSGLLYHFLINK